METVRASASYDESQYESVDGKATKILDILDMADIDAGDHRFGHIKIRLFQPGEKLIGHAPVVMFFEGKDWQNNLFISN